MLSLTKEEDDDNEGSGTEEDRVYDTDVGIQYRASPSNDVVATDIQEGLEVRRMSSGPGTPEGSACSSVGVETSLRGDGPGAQLQMGSGWVEEGLRSLRMDPKDPFSMLVELKSEK